MSTQSPSEALKSGLPVAVYATGRLNQPLAAILSNAQAALRFLKSDKPDLNEFQEIMRGIISDDQRAGNVIRSLRSMMKREEGEKRPTILNDILNDVIQIFRSEAIFRNVHIETELDGSLPPVFGDKDQLQQVDTIDIGFLIGGLNGKPFFKGCFTQILIETDELEASRRFLGPHEGCRKL
jgi:phosphoglycerate-specific signal transduction histidine kinase